MAWSQRGLRPSTDERYADPATSGLRVLPGPDPLDGKAQRGGQRTNHYSHTEKDDE